MKIKKPEIIRLLFDSYVKEVLCSFNFTLIQYSFHIALNSMEHERYMTKDYSSHEPRKLVTQLIAKYLSYTIPSLNSLIFN